MQICLPGGCNTECLLKWSGGGGDAPGGTQTSVEPLVCVECPESLDVTEPARTNPTSEYDRIVDRFCVGYIIHINIK